MPTQDQRTNNDLLTQYTENKRPSNRNSTKYLNSGAKKV